MAIKKKKATKRKPAALKLDPQEEHLLVLIAASERAISKHGSGIDEFFAQQVARLKLQLEEHKAKK